MSARPIAGIACDERQTCSAAPQKMSALKLKKSIVIIFVFIWPDCDVLK